MYNVVMQVFKAVGFDIGGVLISYSIPRQLEVISHELKVPLESVTEAYRQLRPGLDIDAVSNQEFWAELIRMAGSMADPVATEHLWSDNYIQENPFIDGMLALVDKLKQQHYKLGVLSNIDREHAEINRSRHIYDRFDVVLLSDEIQARKPDPDVFQELAFRLGVRPAELVFIDDLPENIAGAQKIGVHGILFRGYRQLIDELKQQGIQAGR
jgi:putative hydrolase of the HAD superfamily